MSKMKRRDDGISGRGKVQAKAWRQQRGQKVLWLVVPEANIRESPGSSLADQVPTKLNWVALEVLHVNELPGGTMLPIWELHFEDKALRRRFKKIINFKDDC